MLHSLDITERKEDKLYNLYRVKISQEGLTKTLKGASERCHTLWGTSSNEKQIPWQDPSEGRKRMQIFLMLKGSREEARMRHLNVEETKAVIHESSMSMDSVPSKAGGSGWESKVQSTKLTSGGQYPSCPLARSAYLYYLSPIPLEFDWLSQMFQSPSPSISSSEPCSLSSLLGSHAVRGSARVLFFDLTQAMTLLSGIGQALPFRSTL